MKRAAIIISVLLTASADSQVSQTPLPRPGNLADILTCAGANEILWTTAIRQDPYDRKAHEAMRKASWYTAVALSIFQVQTLQILDAVETAKKHEPREETFNTALSCRAAPDDWRE